MGRPLVSATISGLNLINCVGYGLFRFRLKNYAPMCIFFTMVTRLILNVLIVYDKIPGDV